MRRFEISAFLAGIVYFVATVTFTYADARFYIPIFFLLVALAVLPAEWAAERSSKDALFGLNAWSAGDIPAYLYWLSITIRFQTEDESIPSLGRSSLRKQQWKINLVRGAKGIHSHLSGQTRHCFIRHRSLLFECAIAEAIRSGSD